MLLPVWRLRVQAVPELGVGGQAPHVAPASNARFRRAFGLAQYADLAAPGARGQSDGPKQIGDTSLDAPQAMLHHTQMHLVVVMVGIDGCGPVDRPVGRLAFPRRS